MSDNARGMISDSGSGSLTKQQSASNTGKASSVRRSGLSIRQNRSLHDATLQMAKGIRGVPQEIANRWYAFSRSESRPVNGHALGNFPEFARAFARKGQSYTNVTAPVFQVCAELKRDFYRTELPSLEAIEEREADDECKLHKAEIKHDPNALKEAARDMAEAAELLAEVADSEINKEGN